MVSLAWEGYLYENSISIANTREGAHAKQGRVGRGVLYLRYRVILLFFCWGVFVSPSFSFFLLRVCFLLNKVNVTGLLHT